MIRIHQSHETPHAILNNTQVYLRTGNRNKPERLADIREIADRHQLSVHMDGARLFNAANALDIQPCDLTQYVDSVTFCLSKGLSAPVGSVLCGSADYIAKARRVRKALGGGMRQAGILAAAGLVSLERMVGRLVEDHQHARLLANGLAEIRGITLDVDMVKTNIVFFDLDDNVPFSTKEIVQRMRDEANIWVGTSGSRRFRAVTHVWISRDDIEVFLNLMEEILQD